MVNVHRDWWEITTKVMECGWCHRMIDPGESVWHQLWPLSGQEREQAGVDDVVVTVCEPCALMGPATDG